MPSLSGVFRLLSIITGVSMIGACATTEPITEPSSTKPAQTESAGASEPVNGGVAGAEAVGKELPPELVAELRLEGADADGRLLTLAPGFIATVECSDCGAPSYLRFLAVRCADTRHCEILTEQCEGEISRDDRIFTIDLAPVEPGATEVCAGYSGVFEAP